MRHHTLLGRLEKMEEHLHPEFPALLVENDGSLAVLFLNTEWTDDVDQWFWSSADVYLIDQSLNRFDPIADRSQDGRPTGIPKWRCSMKVSPDFVEELIAKDPDSDPDDPAFAPFIHNHTGS